MDSSPKSDGSGEWEHTNTDQSSPSERNTDATSPSQPDTNGHGRVLDGSIDGSVSVGLGAGDPGERIADLVSESDFIDDPSITVFSPTTQDEGDPTPPPPETPSRSSNLADRRGMSPKPVRFAVPKLKVEGKPAPSLALSDNGIPTAVSMPTPKDAGERLASIMVKLDLMPAMIALRASARPGAKPVEAYKALSLAQAARKEAQAKGVDRALIAQCEYYMGIASFAIGNPVQTTLKLLEDAASGSRQNSKEGLRAESWIHYVEKQQEAKARSEEASRPSSVMSAITNPVSAVLCALRRGSQSSTSTKAPDPKPTPQQPGLYAQMAPARRQILTIKPATKRMTLSTTSSDPPPRNTSSTESLLPSFHSRPSSIRADSLQNVPQIYRPEKDSQGNFEHYNTGLKYNEDQPYGIDIPFVESPEKYAPDSKPPKRSIPPRYFELYVANPEKEEDVHRAAAGMGERTVQVEEEEEEVFGDVSPSARRRGSWIIQRLSLSRPGDREAGSLTKSLEALVEEGASPVFKPKEWGAI